jgi:HD-GYP domain-containing protein (c-di-GMP phosphodiesterase class II)
VCEISVAGDKYLSLPLEITSQSSQPSGFHLRTLQNVSAASAPLQSALLGVFLTTGGIALLGMLGVSLISARSIVRPLASLVDGLRQGTAKGTLPQFTVAPGSVHEIQELMRWFNEAAAAIASARENLVHAYLEFVGSLAHALDARDPYTAGHSQRVSDYSCATADVMDLSKDEVNTIQVGALLHDIGKLGIPDGILRKAGPLTQEEEDLIREHPVIGRRILEGVHGFEQYLSIVELHHENWDGTGYPHGLKGDATPLEARIVKVADAYDAMTSDRPYRKGMSHEAALRILRANVGTQLDPDVFEAFARLKLQSGRAPATRDIPADALNNLAEAMRQESGASSARQSETHEVNR